MIPNTITKMRLGFNTSGNLQTSGRTTQSVGLGKTRSTIGSITRKFNYCNRGQPPLGVAYNCTFDNIIKFDPIDPSDGNYITIVCQDGNILVSSDSGKIFTTIQSSPTITDLFQVTISFDGKYQVISDINTSTNNSIAISSNYGGSFAQPQGLPTSDLGFISLSSSRTGKYQTCVSAQNDNLIYISSDYGNNWVFSNQPDNKGPNAGAAIQIICTNMDYTGNRQVALIVTNNPSSDIYLSNDYGNNWNKISSLTNINLFSLWVSDDASITVAGELNSSGFPIWYSNNLGNSWIQSTFDGVSSLIPPSIFAIQTSFDGQTQIAGGGYSYGQYITQTALFISRNGGENWNIAPVPTDLYWLSVSISKKGKTMVAVSCDSSDDGFHPSPSGTYYFYVSYDSGYTWSHTTLAYPGVGIYIN